MSSSDALAQQYADLYGGTADHYAELIRQGKIR